MLATSGPLRKTGGTRKLSIDRIKRAFADLTILGYKVHPAAALLHEPTRAEFELLKADIAEHGIRQPVVMFTDPDTGEESILDGRSRARAWEVLGKPRETLPTVSFDTLSSHGADLDPIAYVLSMNLARRHLTESQRAMVAAKLATMQQGRQKSNAQICAFDQTDQDGQKKGQKAGAQICAPSQTEAAGRLNVSRRSVQAARVVQEKGSPALIQQVERGEVAVSAAAKMLAPPPTPQPLTVPPIPLPTLVKAEPVPLVDLRDVRLVLQVRTVRCGIDTEPTRNKTGPMWDAKRAWEGRHHRFSEALAAFIGPGFIDGIFLPDCRAHGTREEWRAVVELAKSFADDVARQQEAAAEAAREEAEDIEADPLDVTS